MNSIKAENRELALDVNQPKESPPKPHQGARARGYYLALTFGTLLSSQGADAHGPRPCGRGPRRTSRCYTAHQGVFHGPPEAPRRGSRAAQRRSYGGPRDVSNEYGGDPRHPSGTGSDSSGPP